MKKLQNHQILKLSGAREENRTPTSVDTRPSNVPVYQFQHSRKRMMDYNRIIEIVKQKFYFFEYIFCFLFLCMFSLII